MANSGSKKYTVTYDFESYPDKDLSEMMSRHIAEEIDKEIVQGILDQYEAHRRSLLTPKEREAEDIITKLKTAPKVVNNSYNSLKSKDINSMYSHIFNITKFINDQN